MWTSSGELKLKAFEIVLKIWQNILQLNDLSRGLKIQRNKATLRNSRCYIKNISFRIANLYLNPAVSDPRQTMSYVYV